MLHDTIIKEFHDQAYKWSLTICRGNKELASDVLQDVYLKIWEGKATFGNRSTFRTWIFSLIRYTAIDYFRKHDRHKFIDLDEALDIAAPVEADVQDEHVWEQLLQKLSGMQRATLQLVFFHNCTVEETAEILNITPGTASTHYKRGKENLKKIAAKLKIK